MKQQTIQTIAKALKTDLNAEGLKRYLAEQVRMIDNERKHGRSTKRYELYKAAAELALQSS